MIMLRKRTTYILLGIMSVFILQGCVSKDEAAEELIHYFNEDIRAGHGDEISETTNKVMGLYFNSDDINEEFQLYLSDELLPVIKKQIEYLESLDYESRGVRKLNKLDLKLIEFMYERYQEMEQSLREGSTIEEVEEEFGLSSKEFDVRSKRYFDQRDKLIEKYGLEVYKDDNGDDKLRKKDESD